MAPPLQNLLAASSLLRFKPSINCQLSKRTQLEKSKLNTGRVFTYQSHQFIRTGWQNISTFTFSHFYIDSFQYNKNHIIHIHILTDLIHPPNSSGTGWRQAFSLEELPLLREKCNWNTKLQYYIGRGGSAETPKMYYVIYERPLRKILKFFWKQKCTDTQIP